MAGAIKAITRNFAWIRCSRPARRSSCSTCWDAMGILAPLKELLIRRTEGNPFFAEESVRSLVEAGVLVGEKGAYRPGLKIDEIRIPSTVQNVVADRIDRLPTRGKTSSTDCRRYRSHRSRAALLQRRGRIAGRRTSNVTLRISKPASFSMRAIYFRNSNTLSNMP